MRYFARTRVDTQLDFSPTPFAYRERDGRFENPKIKLTTAGDS